MEAKKKQSEKMSRTQKVIVVVTAVVLVVILILMIAARYMGSGNTYPINSQPNSSAAETPSNSSEPDGGNAGSQAVPGGVPSVGPVIPNVPDMPALPDLPNLPDFPEFPDNPQQGGSSGTDGGTDTPSTTPSKPDDSSKPSDPSEPDDSSKPSEPSEPDDGNSSDGSEKPDDGQTGGIPDGATVSLISVNSSTVSFQIGNETVVIPVQTTVFNGRVTKSGVLSDSLCGYSIGASVMLYYPEDGDLNGVTLSGAYVKADSSRLTVSGDYNGDGSKIVFRLNGVKLA